MFELRILYFLYIGSLITFEARSEQRALCDIWEEDIPVMAHLAVAMDGTVLLFREQREKKCIEVKRSKDGGVSWSEYKSVGIRIKIEDDMSDDGRYKGEHVGFYSNGLRVSPNGCWGFVCFYDFFLHLIASLPNFLTGPDSIQKEIFGGVALAELNGSGLLQISSLPMCLLLNYAPRRQCCLCLSPFL